MPANGDQIGSVKIGEIRKIVKYILLLTKDRYLLII